jgi:hypothetical protein
MDALRARADALARELDERTASLASMKAELETFRIRYRQQVGLLHDQLDELEFAIAEAELGELSRRIESEGGDANGSTPPSRGAADGAPARYTSDAVRTLFRDVAKTIHPDLARDEQARDRRHALMVEANRAYMLGDEAHLRWILAAWERSPEAVRGSDAEAMRLRLVRRIASLEEQLDLTAGDVAAMQDSPLWKLKAMVDEAAAKGKDIVADMVARLKRDIMVATNRLDAMRPPE